MENSALPDGQRGAKIKGRFNIALKFNPQP